MSKRSFVQRLDSLRSQIEKRRGLGHRWRRIALDYPPVPPGTLCAIYKGRVPRKPAYLKALGLPLPKTAVVKACPKCGRIHPLRKTCPPVPQPYETWKEAHRTLLENIVAWAESLPPRPRWPKRAYHNRRPRR